MSQEPPYSELMTAIVDLHGAVTHGFARVDARLAQMDARMDRMDLRFDGIDGRLDRIERRVTLISGEVSGTQRWMAQSDRRFDALELRGH